jgi:hypothetical protein
MVPQPFQTLRQEFLYHRQESARQLNIPPGNNHSASSLLLCTSQQLAVMETEYTATGTNSGITGKSETHFYLNLK